MNRYIYFLIIIISHAKIVSKCLQQFSSLTCVIQRILCHALQKEFAYRSCIIFSVPRQLVQRIPPFEINSFSVECTFGQQSSDNVHVTFAHGNVQGVVTVGVSSVEVYTVLCSRMQSSTVIIIFVM